MQISRDQFRRAYDAKTLRLSFIGMSNIGKSYLASKMKSELGFTTIEIDDRIQARMSQSGMNESAAWMGFPYSEGYAARERAYLDLEAEETVSAMAEAQGNCIIDTTGSVIHLGAEVLRTLRETCLIVNIDADAADLSILADLYFKHPKPTVWGPYFEANAASTPQSALLASLPKLLEARQNLYRSLEDVRLPAAVLREQGYDPEKAINLIKNQL